MSIEGASSLQNPSILQAQEVLEALVSVGVEEFAYCPGSRNAPFAYVLQALEAAGQVRVHPFAEERGAGFWAVGAAKALRGQVPVVVVTTSGTAAAELHPALEEAKHQGLPILAVTADRPFELTGVGASQATNQVGLFGSTIPDTLDIPAATGAGVAGRIHRYVKAVRGRGVQPSPGHINVRFRDPLVPATPVELSALQKEASRTKLGESALLPLMVQTWSETVDPSLRTVVVAGDCLPAAMPEALLLGQAAARQGIPIIAEPSSELTTLPTWIPHGPWVVESLGNRVEQVIVVGKPTLNRAVAALLASPEARLVVVSAQAEWPDPAFNAAVVVEALRDEPAQTELSPEELRNRQSWLELWRSAASAIDTVFDEDEDEARDGSGSCEGVDLLRAASLIWSSDGAALWLGASNTIRAFDLAASGTSAGLASSNRGLAGIDGTIASALGYQFVTGAPLRVVLGDLTFCYDLASLAARPDGDQDIQIIVLDDHGGSIFRSLEHGGVAEEGMYQRFFAVPQTIDVAVAASSCGWESVKVETEEQLRKALGKPVKGRSVIWVRLRPPLESLTLTRTLALEAVKLALR